MNYKKITELFLHDKYEHHLSGKCWRIGNYTYATDTISMVRVPSLDEELASEKIAEKLLSVWPKQTLLTSDIVHYDKLRDGIEKAPLTDITERLKCPECGGGFYVENTYVDKSGAYHVRKIDCPVCNAEGYINRVIGQEPDPKAICMIFGKPFCMNLVVRLAKVMEIMKAKEAVIIADMGRYELTMFRIGDVEILLMPSLSDDKPCFTIN